MAKTFAIATALAFLVIAAGGASASSDLEGRGESAAGDSSSSSGTSSWRLQSVVSIPINADGGSGKQDSYSYYQGDTVCHCIGWDWLGNCNHYYGVGDWRVKWYNTRYEGANSRLVISGVVDEAVYHVQAEATGYFSEGCNVNLQGGYALGQGLAQVLTKTFHGISGKASGYTRIGVTIPFTGLSVSAPVLVYTSGWASWHGSGIHWDFSYSGDAHVALPTVPSVTNLAVSGSSIA